MSTAMFKAPRKASRVKVALSLLACVLAALGAGQIAAFPSIVSNSANHGASR
jgi:hypothetical protein